MSWKNNYNTNGYAIIPSLLKPSEIEELRLAFEEILDIDQSNSKLTQFEHTEVKGERKLFFVKWPSATIRTFDNYRLHPRLIDVVTDVLGPNLRQITNQLHFKFPGDGVNFPFHQDAAFRKPTEDYKDLHSSFLQTAISVDPSTRENGCLIFFPRSHEQKRLLLSQEGEAKDLNDLNQKSIEDLGDPVHCETQPGDLVIWNPFTAHGSMPNRSDNSRRLYINGFNITENTSHGMEVLRDGKPLPLDTQNELIWDQVRPHRKLA